jgi:hemerythrin-like domain-containing protein
MDKIFKYKIGQEVKVLVEHDHGQDCRLETKKILGRRFQFREGKFMPTGTQIDYLFEHNQLISEHIIDEDNWKEVLK